MSKLRKNLIDFVIALLSLIWIASWYFETPPYVLLHDELVKRWQFHQPALLVLLPLALTFSWLIFSRFTFTHRFDRQLSYAQLTRELQTRFIYLCLLLVAIGVVGFTFFTLAKQAPTHSQELTALDASQAPDKPVWMRKVKVEGQPNAEFIVIKRDRQSPEWTQLQRFIPILNNNTKTDAEKGQVIHYSSTLSSSVSKEVSAGAASNIGYVSWRLLPYSARKAYADNGLTVPLFTYVISSEFTDLGPYLGTAGFLCLLLTLILAIRILLTKYIHRRKLQYLWDYERGYSAGKDVSADLFPWSNRK